MIKLIRRLWAYLTKGAEVKFEEKADPKIQMEQAIAEAQSSHQKLKGHAASVIAGQRQAERALEQDMAQLEKLQRNVRTALTKQKSPCRFF